MRPGFRSTSFREQSLYRTDTQPKIRRMPPIQDNDPEKHSLLAITAPIAGMLAVFLAVAEVILDWGTQIRTNVSILYGLPLVVAASTRNRWLLWALALVLLVTTFAVCWVQTPPGEFSIYEEHFINRMLAALALLVTAALLHVAMRGLDILNAQRRTLREQNEELQRRRREAEAANSRKTQLLTTVSHDIRTPLQAITMMADVLIQATNTPQLTAQVPDLAYRLQANARTLADLVGDVLDLARVDASQGRSQTVDFSLNELIDQQTALARPLAEAKGLRLKIMLSDTELTLQTDRMKLIRIIGNLLGNAVKFTSCGGVTISAAQEADGAVIISVVDTGVGIGAGELERIFDEFVQLSNRGRRHRRAWARTGNLPPIGNGTRRTDHRQEQAGPRQPIRCRSACQVPHEPAPACGPSP